MFANRPFDLVVPGLQRILKPYGCALVIDAFWFDFVDCLCEETGKSTEIDVKQIELWMHEDRYDAIMEYAKEIARRATSPMQYFIVESLSKR